MTQPDFPEKLAVRFRLTEGWRRDREISECEVDLGLYLTCQARDKEGRWEVWRSGKVERKLLGILIQRRVYYFNIVDIEDVGNGEMAGLILHIKQPADQWHRDVAWLTGEAVRWTRGEIPR